MIQFLKSTLGNKILMALSGGFIMFFLVAHLLGNLGMFSGRETVNSYAVFLKSMPAVLWGLRILMILAFVTHIATALKLTLMNRAARPEKYALKKNRKASLASRTMMWSGMLFLSFLIYHLAHFTWGLTHPEHASLLDAQGRHDVYGMMVLGFQSPLVSVFYLFAQASLFFHLQHGFSSAAQTMGLRSPLTRTLLEKGGIAFAAIITLGYASIPFSVWTGFITFN